VPLSVHWHRFVPWRALPAFGACQEYRVLMQPVLMSHISTGSSNKWFLWSVSLACFLVVSEVKHKFFAWLLVQSKILTADKLLARQWPCNPLCPLCNQEQETAEHLVLHCNFAKLVWEKMEVWTQQLVRPPENGLEIVDWWQKELAQLPKQTRKTKAAMMIYCAWNLWKERNRRVFEQKQKAPASRGAARDQARSD